MGGGQDKPAWTACPPGVKITWVGDKITRDSLPPGGASCPGGQDKLLHRPKSFKHVTVLLYPVGRTRLKEMTTVYIPSGDLLTHDPVTILSVFATANDNSIACNC